MQCSRVAGRISCVDPSNRLTAGVAAADASVDSADPWDGPMGATTDERSGAVPSFDAWVAARGPALIGFAYLVTADRARAEEAVQDALSRAYGKWARVCRGQDPEPYVRRMIVNADISGLAPLRQARDAGRRGV